MILINTVENSLVDLKNKGNLDVAFDSYNPNGYFEKVYHITYNPKDEEIASENNIIIVCPFYFKFLYKFKDNKKLKLLLYPFIYIFHIFYLAYFINKKNIDIARGRMPYLMSYALGIASKINKIPFIVSLGGDNRLAQEKIGQYHLFNIRWLSYWIEERVINLSNCTIAPNLYTKKYIENISKQQNIEINPLPIRKSFFDDIQIRDEKRENYFLFIGRLIGDKHPDFVINLFSEYIKKNEDREMRLKFIGDGVLLDKLKAQTVKLKIDNRVDFLGFLEADNIKKYIKKAKVSLIPISGFVIYETAIFANPIITSDIEWHSEFIKHNKNGWVCRYLDIEDWSNQLVKLINNYDETLRTSLNLKEEIIKFHPNKIFDKDIEIYNREIYR